MKRHIEPLLWSLFGAGGTTIAFFFPAIILVVLLVSMGVIPAEALAYERLSGFFLNNIIGQLLLLVAVVPSYWACIHRIYHGSHDLGIHLGGWFKLLCYGGTLVLSVVTVVKVLF